MLCSTSFFYQDETITLSKAKDAFTRLTRGVTGWVVKSQSGTKVFKRSAAASRYRAKEAERAAVQEGYLVVVD